MAEQKQDDKLEPTYSSSREDLPDAMKDRERWRDRFRYIRVDGHSKIIMKVYYTEE